MPERSVDALAAIVSAPPGGVLFHCMGGRDRTGLIAMLLLAAVEVVPDEIVGDYLETVRRGQLRAAARADGTNDEDFIEQFCRSHGTTTEGAFRSALRSLELAEVLDAGGMSPPHRAALMNWRGTLRR